jgi:hypothetical protein
LDVIDGNTVLARRWSGVEFELESSCSGTQALRFLAGRAAAIHHLCACEARSGACLRLSAMDVRNALSVDGRHVGGCMKSWPGLVELQYLASNICRFQVTCSHSEQRGPCSSSTRPPFHGQHRGSTKYRTHAVNLIPIPPQRRASVAQKFRTRTANSPSFSIPACHSPRHGSSRPLLPVGQPTRVTALPIAIALRTLQHRVSPRHAFTIGRQPIFNNGDMFCRLGTGDLGPVWRCPCIS